MELICHQDSPALFQIFFGISLAETFFGKYGEHLVSCEEIFTSAVVLLDESLACEGASVVFVNKLAVPYGKLVLVSRHCFKEVVNVTDFSLGQTGKILKASASFEHISCRAAAAVTVAVHTHCGVENVLVVAFPVEGHKLVNSEMAVICRAHKVSVNSVAVVALPHKHTVGEFGCIVI